MLTTLILVAANDDRGLSKQSSVTFTADLSQYYSIKVAGYNGASGSITLNHPLSADALPQPTVSLDKVPEKMFFRLKGDRFSDRDTDGDGLVVWEERLLGTDPTKADTDGDGMSDSHEFTHDFDPNNPADATLDADGDGISNVNEIATGTHPRNPDSDGNGINDALEDPDGDTLANAEELNIHNTNPLSPDTDGDQMPDNWELDHGLDPTEADGADGQDGDPDGDGISNFDEYLNGTDPQTKDSDGDGVDDDIEIDQGSDPNSSADEGKIPEEVLKELTFRVGDPSDSHSENWLLCIRGVGDDPDTRRLKVKGRDFGVMSDPRSFKLRVGKSYEITVLHQGTKPDEDPDYDWEATIDSLPHGVANIVGPGDSVSETEAFIVGDYWIVDNRKAVLTKEKHGDDMNIIQGKKAYLRPIEIVPDYNRDGKIDLADRGRVTEENPWRWWINDDDDRLDEDRGNNLRDISMTDTSKQDCNDKKVDGMRDLLDFFPLHLDLKAATEIFPNSRFKYILKHEESAFHFYEDKFTKLEATLPHNAINNYIISELAAHQHKDKDLLHITASGVELPEAIMNAFSNGNGTIVLEGNKLALKPIVLEIVNRQDGEVAMDLVLNINLGLVETMFRRLNLRSVTQGSGGLPTNMGRQYEYPDELTNGKYLAYIHGYNVSGVSARGSQSNIFKRMHQLGSKARFIGVYWNGTPNPPTTAISAIPPDYHQAVQNGFITGSELVDKFNELIEEGADITIMAHSLGNVPASHAIANMGLNVTNYFMINGAVPIEAYDEEQPDDTMARNMTEDDWKPFYDYGEGDDKGSEKRLFASKWYDLFPEKDNRNKLTWRNLFAKPALLTKAYNFYSQGDEVVENANETEEFGDWDNLAWSASGRHAWVQQEIAKGGQNSLAGIGLKDLNGGWGFSNLYLSDSPLFYTFPHWTVDNITKQDLRTKPYHKSFFYSDLYDSEKGSATAADNRFQILATGVPAMSYAIAVNPIDPLNALNNDGVERNYNMQAELKGSNIVTWPALDAQHQLDWGHSDFKDISIQFVYPMYRKILTLAKLNEE